jgi:hypothetical protein
MALPPPMPMTPEGRLSCLPAICSFYLHDELVHIDGFGLIIDVDPDESGRRHSLAAGSSSGLFLKTSSTRKTMTDSFPWRCSCRISPSCEEASPPEDHFGDHFKIAKHVDFLFRYFFMLF